MLPPLGKRFEARAGCDIGNKRRIHTFRFYFFFPGGFSVWVWFFATDFVFYRACLTKPFETKLGRDLNLNPELELGANYEIHTFQFCQVKLIRFVL